MHTISPWHISDNSNQFHRDNKITSYRGGFIDIPCMLVYLLCFFSGYSTSALIYFLLRQTYLSRANNRSAGAQQQPSLADLLTAINIIPFSHHPQYASFEKITGQLIKTSCTYKTFSAHISQSSFSPYSACLPRPPTTPTGILSSIHPDSFYRYWYQQLYYS